jgi:hypothetical protein
VGQNGTKQKELELRERELALKEKELEIELENNSKNLITPNIEKTVTQTQNNSLLFDIEGNWYGINCDFGQTDRHELKVKKINSTTYNFEMTLNDGYAEYWFKSKFILNSNNEFIGNVNFFQGDREIPNFQVKIKYDDKSNLILLNFITKTIDDECFNRGLKFKK